MYNKVVVAIDLSDESGSVIEHALELVESQADKLILVHAVEPVPPVWGGESYALDPVDLQQRIVDHAAGLLEEFASGHGISAAQVTTVLGAPAAEIRAVAESERADAIVIGSHGHSGWKIMLGSTAIKLLHGATCDVLTVHVGERS